MQLDQIDKTSWDLLIPPREQIQLEHNPQRQSVHPQTAGPKPPCQAPNFPAQTDSPDTATRHGKLVPGKGNLGEL